MYHQCKHAYITFDTARIELLEYSLRRKTNGMITKRSVYQTTNLRVIDTEFLWLSWFANHHLLNLCSPCKTIWRSELLIITIYSGFKWNDNWLWHWIECILQRNHLTPWHHIQYITCHWCVYRQNFSQIGACLLMECEVSKDDNSLKCGKIMYVYVRVDFIVLSDSWLQH